VGSGVVHELAVHATVPRIIVTDPRDGVLQAHVIDISESVLVGGGPEVEIIVADDPCGADLTVVAASLPETPNGDRRHFLQANWELLRGLVPVLERSAARAGVVLLLSNPVDVLAECLRRISVLRPEQILGYSLNDGVRLRAAVARELDVAVTRVGAWVLGEHGDGQVPLFSRIRVDGEPVELPPDAEARVRADVMGWFARWSALGPGRSSGWTTARGVRVCVEAMRDGALLPSSVATGAGPYPLPDAYLTLPTVLGHGGVVRVEGWPLADTELAQLEAAAQRVRRSALEVLDGKRG
jgi:malate/lactate dehydrogenase